MDPLSSPFPGMDPFLEVPYRWKSVHTRLIVGMSDALSAQLPPEYAVEIEERVYITQPGDPDRRSIEPDVYIVQEIATPYLVLPVTSAVTPPSILQTLDSDPRVEDRYLEIRDSASREVVTTLELLSPFNKRPGAQGFDAFQNKRSAVMASKSHWIEIDLLRAGARPAEVAFNGDYYALLKRGDRPRAFAVWFFNLQNRMPTMAVPLRPPHADVPLDLQAVWDEMYRRARYAQSIDYNQPPPPPPLRPDDEGWAQVRIQTWQTARQPSIEIEATSG
ncbi:MAG: DUF4058 family protein [Chloroflexi bacterium]|nr:DUF4058 family protein [Chloroflexota bacterium]